MNEEAQESENIVPEETSSSNGEVAGAGGGTGSEDRAESSEPTKRATFARLRDEEQRVAGGGRWSVDSSRRFCALTGEEIPRGTPFWTVLAPTDPDSAPESAGPLTAFFSRKDYCDEAMDKVDQGNSFARWRTVIAEEEGPAKRVVNIASLLATFLELADSTRVQPEGQGEEGSGEDSPANLAETASLAETGADVAEDLSVPMKGPSGLTVDSGTDRLRLAYLLGLFLVRKRSLIWEDHDENLLILREKVSGDLYQLPAPDLDPQTLEQAVNEIEALFS
ncbi:MAG: hypothetical protein CBC13_05330 [Planctomycetia bacterium TMED53]|nr:MAG: hypothetical protein CBC13_05330 [Planctomycetia bacterium TMED53]